MLRKAATNKGRDWDKLVPYLPFTYREVLWLVEPLKIGVGTSQSIRFLALLSISINRLHVYEMKVQELFEGSVAVL